MVAISCDGASVMTGSKGGVGAILRKEQPSLVTIHCMAHRLELSLKDAVKSVKLYDKTVNVLAMGLYYFYHNSSLNRSMLIRSACALKTDSDKSLLLPTRVGGTRWIGHTALALEHITVSYKYLTGHLGQVTEPVERVSVDSRAKAKAFLKCLQTMSTLYFIYFLMDVLTVLKRLSLGVQNRQCVISEQHSTLESVVEVLSGYKSSDGPNLRRIRDSQIELKGDDREFSSARRKLIDNIEAALMRRFADFSSLGVIRATRIADMQAWQKTWDILKGFGTEELLILIDHFGILLNGAAGLKCDEIEMEWSMLKKDMSENTDKLETWKAVNEVYGHKYPNILGVMDLIMTMSPSSAEAERGFSLMKLLKTKIRSNLSQGSLNDLLITKINAPTVEKFDPSDAIYLWNSEGNRTRRVNFKDKLLRKPTEFMLVEQSQSNAVPQSSSVDLSVDISQESQLIESGSVGIVSADIPQESQPVVTQSGSVLISNESQSSSVSLSTEVVSQSNSDLLSDQSNSNTVEAECQTDNSSCEASTQTFGHVTCMSYSTNSSETKSSKYYSSDEEDNNFDSDLDSDLEESIVFSKLLSFERDCS